MVQLAFKSLLKKIKLCASDIVHIYKDYNNQKDTVPFWYSTIDSLGQFKFDFTNNINELSNPFILKVCKKSLHTNNLRIFKNESNF